MPFVGNGLVGRVLKIALVVAALTVEVGRLESLGYIIEDGEYMSTLDVMLMMATEVGGKT